jgi:hypothetical protein
MSGFDQRKAPRVKLEVNCVFWPEDGEAPAAGCLGTTINLSLSGLAMHCDYQLRRHGRMQVEMSLPGSRQSLKLPAQVVDCRHSTDSKWAYQARLSFDDPGPAGLHSLLAFLLPQQRQIDRDGMSPALVEQRGESRSEVELGARYREAGEAELSKLAEQHSYLEMEPLLGSHYFPNMASVLARNISGHGICLLAARPFREGSQLLVELTLPSLGQPLWVLASVQWAREEDSGLYRHAAGLRFQAIRKADALAVEAYIQRQGG